MRAAPIVILEGPDGSGKSTAADYYVRTIGARYVHCGPFKQVTGRNLPRLYLEAMTPALLGCQPIVMDRCWLSEPIYSAVVRSKPSRIDSIDERMLSRVALRSNAFVVLCRPSKETCFSNTETRDEYPSRIQRGAIWHAYGMPFHFNPSLPVIEYDYEKDGDPPEVESIVTNRHMIATNTVGRYGASYVLVGTSRMNYTLTETFYRYPFVSFSNQPSGRWFTNRLAAIGVPENKIFWVDPEVDPDYTIGHQTPKNATYLAFGKDCGDILYKYEKTRKIVYLEHPSHRRHTKPDLPWEELAEALKGAV